MKEFMQKYPKHIAIALGIISGVPPGIERLKEFAFPPMNAANFAIALMIGLLGPPIGATL